MTGGSAGVPDKARTPKHHNGIGAEEIARRVDKNSHGNVTAIPTPIEGETTVTDNADNNVQDNTDGTEKPGGLGKDGTIPADPDGVAAGHTDTPSHFNPEEDEEA